jgi:hypothetical protein
MEVVVSQHATKHGDELLAQILLGSTLGAQVTQHDDGSARSMYDLEICYPDGRLAAAEVVSTRDRLALRQEAAASKHRFTSVPGLLSRWFVTMHPNAQVRRVWQHVPAALAELEHRGVQRLAYRSFALRQSGLADFGVTGCWSTPPTKAYPPGCCLLPDFKFEWGGEGDEVVRRCDEFLPTVPDVASKLIASGLPERHAVVVVTVDWVGPFGGIQSGPVPTLGPTLPEGVDRLWLVTLRHPPIRALYWLGDGTWREATVTAEHLGRSTRSALPPG